MQRLRQLALLALASLSFTACASHESFQVQVLRPAPVDLGQYELVAVDRFEGPDCDILSAAVSDALERSTHPMTGERGFDVMHRSEVDQTLDDMRRRAGSGGLDEHSMKILERWRSADLLLRGQVLASEVVEQVTDREVQDQKGVLHVVQDRVCTSRVAVRIEALDGPGEQLFDRVEFEEVGTQRSEGFDEPAPRIDQVALLESTRQAFVNRYMRRVMPHYEWVRVTLFVDGDLPSLEVGNGYARVGDWDEARSSYQTAVEFATGELAEKQFKALHNIGVASLYIGDFEGARDALKKAYAQSRDRTILAELQNVDRRESEYELLREQTSRAAKPAR